MAPVVNEPKPVATDRPRVLVVDDEPELLELIEDVVGRQVDCQIVAAASLAEARQIIGDGPVGLLVTDVNLPDGDGTSLLPLLRERQPGARAIVITGEPSVERAISALRGGAVDFVPKPFSARHLSERVRAALAQQVAAAKRERRFVRLREAVRRLNDSRKLISKKVDLLCNDLVGAYGDLSKQLDAVRTREGFRKSIARAADLEQLLCHSMDWLLREIGYANVAVFLAADDGMFQLGAYMKYTIAGEALLTDALRRVLVPRAAKDALLRLPSSALADEFTPQEAALLKGQEVLAVNCTYLGESLATLVFFRDEKSPFTEDDESLLKQVSPVFAVELATVVREDEGAADDAPFAEDDGRTDADANNAKPRARKKDPADWWKNGEEPPF